MAREIAASGARCVAIAADVTSQRELERLVSETEAAVGPLDILVNNAGAEGGGRFVRRSPDEIAQVVGVFDYLRGVDEKG